MDPHKLDDRKQILFKESNSWSAYFCQGSILLRAYCLYGPKAYIPFHDVLTC